MAYLSQAQTNERVPKEGNDKAVDKTRRSAVDYNRRIQSVSAMKPQCSVGKLIERMGCLVVFVSS